MSWKSALVSSALALGAQTAIANKPLPCPTTGPLQDVVGVVQGETREKIEKRLRAIDTDKKHQVVVVTVKNVEEYGYGSIEEMANALGNGCKVGYRGENTGVVVLYTQVPSRYRMENAGTERYITDAQSGRILNHSKSDGVCKKEDVSCRLDDITSGIDTLIRTEFPDEKAVQKIKDEVKVSDQAQANKEMTEILGNLGIGAVIVVVVGGGAWGTVAGVGAINRRNRRNQYKKEVLELFVRLQTEKQKYPVWFQKEHITRAEGAITKIHQYSDEQFDRIIGSERMEQDYMRTLRTIKEMIDSWQGEFSRIQSSLDEKAEEFRVQKEQVLQMNSRLLSEGYIFPKREIPNLEGGYNPLDSLAGITRGLRLLSELESSLEEIPRYYRSVEGFAREIQSGFQARETEYLTLSAQYEGIFGKRESLDREELRRKISSGVANFQAVYAKKDISAIRTQVSQGEAILDRLDQANRTMREKIRWYTTIPSEITRRERQLSPLRPDRKYISDAQSYVQKTGKTHFLKYDLAASIATLQTMVSTLRTLHTEKRKLDTLDDELEKFDREYRKIEEYLGLGAALAAIIAAEVAAAARRKREAEEAAQRRKRQEQDEEDARRRRDDESRNSSSNTSSSDNWSSGGGSGFSGGGATTD